MGGFGLAYLWIKSLHVIAVISWMAGMLYLPRLFVYHAAQEKGSANSEMLKIMEYRLLKYIINPAMFVAWLSGLWLVYSAAYWDNYWFLMKFILVLAMSAVHGMLAKERRHFAADENNRSQKYFRVINEIPTVLMIGIVVLVILKPFQ
jgi:protoporphyrinogen IX oxidase